MPLKEDPMFYQLHYNSKLPHPTLGGRSQNRVHISIIHLIRRIQALPYHGYAALGLPSDSIDAQH